MNDRPLLKVEDLSVRVKAGGRVLLREVSFELRAGECLTLLGESGAGKSLLAQAVMGNLPGALVAAGRVTVGGATTAAEAQASRRPLWGRQLALLPQEPSLSLDPLMHLAPQAAEVHRLVRGLDGPSASAVAHDGLAASGLADAATKYPWQVSGGMAQRAAAVVALAGGASVLLVDEPTKGLDAHWRDRMVESLQAVRRAGGCVVVITHDLRVARALGGRLVVLREGDVVEQGDVAQVLASPSHAFTRSLIDADPAHWPRRGEKPVNGAPVIEASGLAKGFGERPLFAGIDLTLHRGERLTVRGPSGVGKSTLGNVLLGLLPADAGEVRRGAGLAPFAFQKLYQDPVASFPPQPLVRSLRDLARLHRQPWSTVEAHLDRLRVPQDILARGPSDVSGGELQRVALARVLTARPAFVFADEPTSRLDPVSQMEAMHVLLDGVEASDAALMLVTHDEDIAQAAATRHLALPAAA